jgi:hypothetical protein
MTTEKENKRKDEDKKNSSLEPDPETLHTTDPQEHMKGPVSSAMQDIKEEAEKNDDKDEQDREK